MPTRVILVLYRVLAHAHARKCQVKAYFIAVVIVFEYIYASIMLVLLLISYINTLYIALLLLSSLPFFFALHLKVPTTNILT